MAFVPFLDKGAGREKRVAVRRSTGEAHMLRWLAFSSDASYARIRFHAFLPIFLGKQAGREERAAVR